jgi:hypothetical protein
VALAIRVLMGVLIGVGVFAIVQGLLAILGKTKLRPNVFEQPLLEALVPKNEVDANRMLGRIRLIFGFFFLVLAFWITRVG